MTNGPARPIVADERFTTIDVDFEPGEEPATVTIGRRAEGGKISEVLGSWEIGVGGGPLSLRIDWLGEGASLLEVRAGSGSVELVNLSANLETTVSPDMLVRIEHGGPAEDIPVRITEPSVLEKYYQRDAHQDEYVVKHPFFEEFHAARLRLLERLFRKYIPSGGRVLDAGSGYSIFFLIPSEFDYRMTCCDLDSAAMEKMKGLVPEWEWLVADAAHLPFEDRLFDALYAGEIIEHVPDPGAAVREWNRVLRPGGVLILSTPNRDRLLSRSNRREMPVHHEHLFEFNLPELESALRAGGFETVARTGIYLELLQNWWRPRGKRVDMLTAHLTGPRGAFIYRAAMALGRLAPGRAYDLVTVSVKRQKP